MDRQTYRKVQLAKITTDYGTGDGGGEEDYDPYANREIEHGTNFPETLMHMLKASLGTGILAMPQAFKHAGWVSGLIFTVVISFLCTYGIHILIRSKYKICKQLRVAYVPYPVAMRASMLIGPMPFTKLAMTAHVVVDTFLIVYQTGVCSAYVIFIAENIKKLVDNSLENPIRLEIYILYLVIPFFLILSIPNMKVLAPFSTFSNILTFVTCGILLYHIFTGLESFSEMDAFGPIQDFPLFIGIVLFAVAAMGVVTTVEKNMDKPKQFTMHFGVLNIAMSIITFSYAGMGLLGYWRHPHNIEPSITLNLDESQVQAKVIQGIYVVAIYITYGLNGIVPVDIVWNNYLSHNFEDSKRAFLWEYVIRFSFVILTLVFALTVPLLGEIISLFGSFCMSTLQITFPAIMHLFVEWPHGLGKGKWILYTDLFMIAFGIVGLLSGTYSSIRDIVFKLKEKYEKGREFY